MSAGGPRDPVSPAKPGGRARGDAPPPAPPRELRRERPEPRAFEHAGHRWIAHIGGKGAYGTGSYGLGLVEAIHFAAADAPDIPLREALIAHGTFESLFDSELGRLLEGATPISPGPGRP
jgi:hypothetical protein